MAQFICMCTGDSTIHLYKAQSLYVSVPSSTHRVCCMHTEQRMIYVAETVTKSTKKTLAPVNNRSV